MTAGGASSLFVGGVAAEQPPARIVGTASPAATRAASDRAAVVRRVLDFGPFGQAVAGRFSDRAVAQLRQRRDVRYVEEDGAVYAIHHRDGHDRGPDGGDGGGGGGVGESSQTLPWGIDRVDAEVAHSNGDTGEGADIAILDTGIDSDHPDLVDNLGDGVAFVNSRGKYAEDWDDDHDHGTHCAGIAAAVDNGEGVVGVAPAATLHAVKVLSKSGSGRFSDVAAGIEYTANQGWDVASMSLGAASGSQTIEKAVNYAYGKGVLVVVAAGNSGECTDCVGYPAAYSNAVAVSSTDRSDDLSSFSSTGPEVEIAAPGEAIYSSIPGGYDTFSGTSMACPHVSGAAALLMAAGYTNTEARDRLTATAEDLGLSATDQGAGLLDVAAALGYDSSDDL
jgi:subtilisin